VSDAAGRRPRLPAVTGVRFVAASHVVLLHYLPKYQLLLAPWWVQNIVGAGYVGVDLFFILSGFVLAYTYLRPLDGPRVDARRFWAARFARIYPLYALSLALAAAFWLPAFLAQGGSKRDALLFPLAAAAMLQAWSPKIATVVNYPAWSLSIEAFFYLSFPLLAPPFARLRGRALVAAAGLLWLGALAAPLLYTGLNPDGIGAGIPDHPARWLRAVIYDPVTRLPEFLLGVTLAVGYLRRRELAPSRWVGGALTVAPVLAILLVLSFSSRLPFVVLHNGLLAPLFACLLYGLALGRGPVVWVLSRPLLVVLGEASYAVYLLQDPIWNVVVHAAWPLVSPGTSGDPWVLYWAHPWLAAIFGPLLVGVSVASFYAYQEPARRWLSTKLGARPPAAAPAVPAAAAEPAVAGE